MDSLNKTLEYHELLMVNNDTSIYNNYLLPDGFNYSFYKDGDMDDWINIHMSSGEFMSYQEGVKIFHDFYDSFIDELPNRLMFVVKDDGEKVGTFTISKLESYEYGYSSVVDWVAIKKSYQGYKLSKPMINRMIKLANDLGINKVLLHTQTHSWLAAKLYLDNNFDPFNAFFDIKGWQILKTITNHFKLSDINSISYDDMFFDVALNVVNYLDNRFGKDNYFYSIWHKNGRNDVFVNCNNILYKFKYYLDDEFIMKELK